MIDLRALQVKPTLSGERVRLVPLGEEHADDYYHSALNQETRRLTGAHRTLAAEEVLEWCASCGDRPDRLDLAVLEEPGGRFAGELTLSDVDADNESATYRIALSSGEFTDRGLGKEATRLVLEYAFGAVGLYRVQLEVFAFNMRAIAAYRACGFQVEGRKREALLWDGRRHDALVMAILRREFHSSGRSPAAAG